MAVHHEEKGGHHHFHPHPQARYYYGYYGPYYQKSTVSADEDIKSDVESALRLDSYVDADRIEVSVQDRAVTLKGHVDNPLEKRAAGDDAWDTAGVVDVNNDLKVA